MSKLVKAVQTADTGRRYPLSHPFIVRSEWNPMPSMAAREYVIGVTVEYRMRVADESSCVTDGSALSEAVRMSKESVIEEVFGEFRAHFRACERALYAQDFVGIRDALRNFEYQMFSEMV